MERPTLRAIVLAAISPLALTLGIPFANRLEPTISGLPFLLAYIIVWILATPALLFLAYRAERARG